MTIATVSVISVIFIILAAFIIYLDIRLRKLEKKQNEK